MAGRAVGDHGPVDVFVIAARSGLKVERRRWHPVTHGEFHSISNTIVINENSMINAGKIVAHELGHFFLQRWTVNRTAGFNEERFCDDFAKHLLRISKDGN